MEIGNWRPITLLGVDYKLLTKTLAERLKQVLPGLIHPDQNGFVPGGNIVFSAHTIRDLLFYCSKEKVDMILMALDYTKAFDSVDFQMVFRSMEVYNFGENFRRWVEILYSGGTSCISNNGFLSDTFPIERSTRQGDPISPLIFILILEILFIYIRADKNIGGIRIMKNEVKLTSFADDATYFMKDRKSVAHLISVIANFSKVSGLQINKTKSECLIFDFELNLNIYDNHLYGVPMVENLKILGHYFGKSKLLCDYNNFYSKLEKFDKITNMWKMRSLTLLGRNLVINALLNSLFLYNAKIEYPPKEFISIIEKKNKNFLWEGGIAKIAHHSLIGDYQQGGIRYKDIDSLIQAQNLKSLLQIKSNCKLNNTCVPRFWILTFFGIIPLEGREKRQSLFDFFSQDLNILDCKFKLPKISKWKGHPSYLFSLKMLGKMIDELPKSFESLLSIPLWFNRGLGTTFDHELSKQGYNYFKDVYFYEQNSDHRIHPRIKMSLTGLKAQVLPYFKRILEVNKSKSVVICPFQTVRINNQDTILQSSSTQVLYKSMISNKVRMPTGLLKWCLDFELSECQIKTALMFTNKCSLSVYDRVFQYKIATNILPTNAYLYRYNVKDTPTCELCQLEYGNIVHRLYECEVIAVNIDQVLKFFSYECNDKYKTSMVEYLFGKSGDSFLALNHALIELKKMVFYATKEVLDSPNFLNCYLKRLRVLMIREKTVHLKNRTIEVFFNKWEHFTSVYDFRGPDQQFLINN